MPKCKYCDRNFMNLQAVRGHLRACPQKLQPRPVAEPRLKKQEPGTGSRDEPGSVYSFQAEVGTPSCGTLTANYLQRMIEAHDLLLTLRKRCQERLWYYQLLDGCPRQDSPTFQDWYQVTFDLLRCERDVQDLVQRSSVSRDCVWSVYQVVRNVKDRWIPWAEREVNQIWKKQDKSETLTEDQVAVEYGLPLLIEQFDRLMELLRRLTAMTRIGI